MSECCVQSECCKEKFNARVEELRAVNTSVSGIIAYLEKLLKDEGPALLTQLPALLIAAHVPSPMIPLIVGIVGYLISLVPAPAAMVEAVAPEFASVVTGVAALGNSFSAIIAYLEQVVREQGSAILVQLPAILTAAHVPAGMIPLVVGVVGYLISLIPAPAAV